jgi:hypothetical protein
MNSPWAARGAVITVATAALLLGTIGGAIVAAPITLPLLYLVARRYPGRGMRITAAVVGGLTCVEAVWALCYLAVEEAMPWIWLLPALAGSAWTAALLRAGPAAVRRQAPAATTDP